MKYGLRVLIAAEALSVASPICAQTKTPTPGGVNTFAPTTNFFADQGANVRRINDRLFVGGASVNDANSADSHLDWLSAHLVGFGVPTRSEAPFASQLLVLNIPSNSTSHIAATFGAESLGQASAAGILGVASYCHNNNPVYATPCWAAYFDAKKMTAIAGAVYAIEGDSGSLVASSTSDPYQQGNVVGLQLASGGEYPLSGQYDISAAIQIQPNPTKFKQGIVFGSGALAPGGYALAMPTGQGFAWYSGAGIADATLMDVAGVLTPSSLALSNATGLPLTSGVTGVLPSANGGVDTSEWTSYAPTAVCTQSTGSANCRATGRYKTIGKTTFVEIGAVVTGSFTGGRIATISLPKATASHGLPAILNGRESAKSGLTWTGYASPGSQTFSPSTFANSPSVLAGYAIYFAGTYESE
jgi:hypothetical protein